MQQKFKPKTWRLDIEVNIGFLSFEFDDDDESSNLDILCFKSYNTKK